MQLIFLILWVLGLGIWATVVFFIRTQMKAIETIRPQIKYVFVAMILATLVFFVIALMSIINYHEVPTTRTSSTPVLQPTNSVRSTTNEKIY